MENKERYHITNMFYIHVPNFVQLERKPDPIPFSTLEELLDIQRVKDFNPTKDVNHLRLSKNYLMFIDNDRLIWYVIGRILHSIEGIAQWEGPKFKVRNEDGTMNILTIDEVVSSCGDELTLRTGGKIKRFR